MKTAIFGLSGSCKTRLESKDYIGDTIEFHFNE